MASQRPTPTRGKQSEDDVVRSRGRAAAASAAEPRFRTPLVVWILVGLAVATALISGLGALRPERALSWVWPAGIGVALGGAAWVMAAMWGTRKLPGIIATVLCVLGMAAPLATGLSHEAAQRSAAEALIQDAENEAAGDAYTEEEAASSVREGVAGARPVGQAVDVGSVHAIVTRVDADADAAIKQADPSAPAPAGVYVLAQVEVTNRGEEALRPGADLAYDLVLADGTAVDALQCSAQLGDTPVLAQDLAPGERGTYRVCFDVPAEYAGSDILPKAAIRVGNVLGDGVTPGYWRVA